MITPCLLPPVLTSSSSSQGESFLSLSKCLSVSKEQLRSIPFSHFLLLISRHTHSARLAASFMWFHRIPGQTGDPHHSLTLHTLWGSQNRREIRGPAHLTPYPTLSTPGSRSPSGTTGSPIRQGHKSVHITELFSTVFRSFMGKATLDEESLEFSQNHRTPWAGRDLQAHPIMSVLLIPSLCFLPLLFCCGAKPGALRSAN